MRRHPHGHIAPGPDFLRGQEFRFNPGKPRVGFRQMPDAFQHFSNRKLLLRSSRVIDSGSALLNHAYGPLREVAYVDELHRVARLARSQHFAAQCNTQRPIREAISFITGSDNQSGTNDERLVRKPFLNFSFRFHLERAVETAVGSE